MNSDKHLRAVLLGATGLIGREVLRRLLDETAYESVTVVGRRELTIRHPKLSFEKLELSELAQSVALKNADHVFCCLGTTMKKAQSEEAFRAVDFWGPVRAAEAALKEKHLKKFLLVSALGADANSKIFYNRVKGETEHALGLLPIPELHIFRPSLLLGDRAESRPGERFAIQATKPIMWAFRGPLKKYKPIDVRAVAHAMLKSAIEKDESGQHFHESEALQ